MTDTCDEKINKNNKNGANIFQLNILVLFYVYLVVTMSMMSR